MAGRKIHNRAHQSHCKFTPLNLGGLHAARSTDTPGPRAFLGSDRSHPLRRILPWLLVPFRFHSDKNPPGPRLPTAAGPSPAAPAHGLGVLVWSRIAARTPPLADSTPPGLCASFRPGHHSALSSFALSPLIPISQHAATPPRRQSTLLWTPSPLELSLHVSDPSAENLVLKNDSSECF